MAQPPIPAAACADAPIPAAKQELIDNWETSIEEVWAKIRDTQAPTKEDWAKLVYAERVNRASWIEAEESGVKKRGKKALADLMGSRVDEKGNLVKGIEKKAKASKAPKAPAKPRAKKAKNTEPVVEASTIPDDLPWET